MRAQSGFASMMPQNIRLHCSLAAQMQSGSRLLLLRLGHLDLTKLI
jgi:hypothetical protein